MYCVVINFLDVVGELKAELSLNARIKREPAFYLVSKAIVADRVCYWLKALGAFIALA